MSLYLPTFDQALAQAANAIDLKNEFAVLPPAKTNALRRALIRKSLETLQQMLPVDGAPAERALKGTVDRILASRQEIDAIAAVVDELLIEGAGRSRPKLPDEADLSLTDSGVPVPTRRDVAGRLIQILNQFAPHY
jgi:hypothetical protein